MNDREFDNAVRDSRVFYRRRLAERLAIAQIRSTGGVDAGVVVKRANEITAGLEALEMAADTGATKGAVDTRPYCMAHDRIGCDDPAHILNRASAQGDGAGE